MTHDPTRRRSPRLTAALAVTSGLAMCALAACGSALDPDEVAGADRAGAPLAGVTNSAGVLVDPTSGATLDPGSGPVIDPTSGATLDPGSGPVIDPTSGATLDPGPGPGPGGTSGPGGSSGPSSGAPSGDPTGAPPAGEKGGCDGFKNQTGITDSEITIANASDISGPVPGLFESAQQATQAYINYFNSQDDICGRKLKLLALDTKGDAGADQQAYTEACGKAFAVVGSVAANDQGGASTANSCGIPDLRAFVVTPDRRKCASCYSTYNNATNLTPRAFGDFWVKKDKTAVQNAAMLYVDVPASSGTSQSYVKSLETIGWKFTVNEAIPQDTFNYTTYAQKMKDAKVQYVQYFGPYQFTEKLQSAMKQIGFTPKYFLQDGTIYDPDYVSEASEAGIGAGSYVYTEQQPFEKAASYPELALYQSYLRQLDASANPSTYGVFAWSAARLFVEQAAALGGKLTRPSLLQSLSKVKGWTGNKMHAPNDVGTKLTSPCLKILQLSSSYTWSQVSPGDFLCGDLIDSGVGR